MAEPTTHNRPHGGKFADTFHDSTYVKPYLKAGDWRICWLTNNDCWRLDNAATGMMVTFDSILISGGHVQFSRDGNRTATFIDGVFPEKIENWIRTVEHTGTIERNDA